MIGGIGAVYRGKMSMDTYLAHVDQIASYLNSKGMYFYPSCAAGGSHIAGIPISWLADACTQVAHTLDKYPNVVGLDLIQEYLGGCLQTVPGMTYDQVYAKCVSDAQIMYNTVKAAVPGIPLVLSYSMSWNEPRSLTDFGLLSDMYDWHMYTWEQPTDSQLATYASGPKPIIAGEFGDTAADMDNVYQEAVKYDIDVFEWCIQDSGPLSGTPYGLYDPGGTLKNQARIDSLLRFPSSGFFNPAGGICGTCTGGQTCNTTTGQCQTTNNNVATIYYWPNSTMRGIVVGGEGLSTLTEQDFIKLQGWHVNIIRLDLSGPNPGEIERVVNLSRKYNIKVVLALMSLPSAYASNQGSPWNFADATFWSDFNAQTPVINFWTNIATRFKDSGDVIAGYDLINEPTPTDNDRGDNCPLNCPATLGSPKDLGYFYTRTINAIRAIDPHHTIVLESRCGGQLCWKTVNGVWQYAVSMPILNSSNIVYGFHWYNPNNYCEQGVGSNPSNIPYPGTVQYYGYFDASRTNSEIAKINDFANANHAKIFIGEYSVAAWAPNAAGWITDVTSSFDQYGFSTTYHTYNEYEGWNLELGSPDRLNVMKNYWSKNN